MLETWQETQNFGPEPELCVNTKHLSASHLLSFYELIDIPSSHTAASPVQELLMGQRTGLGEAEGPPAKGHVPVPQLTSPPLNNITPGFYWNLRYAPNNL